MLKYKAKIKERTSRKFRNRFRGKTTILTRDGVDEMINQ